MVYTVYIYICTTIYHISYIIYRISHIIYTSMGFQPTCRRQKILVSFGLLRWVHQRKDHSLRAWLSTTFTPRDQAGAATATVGNAPSIGCLFLVISWDLTNWMRQQIQCDHPMNPLWIHLDLSLISCEVATTTGSWFCLGFLRAGFGLPSGNWCDFYRRSSTMAIPSYSLSCFRCFWGYGSKMAPEFLLHLR